MHDHPVVSWKPRHPPPRWMPRNTYAVTVGSRYFSRRTVMIAFPLQHGVTRPYISVPSSCTRDSPRQSIGRSQTAMHLHYKGHTIELIPSAEGLMWACQYVIMKFNETAIAGFPDGNTYDTREERRLRH